MKNIALCCKHTRFSENFTIDLKEICRNISIVIISANVRLIYYTGQGNVSMCRRWVHNMYNVLLLQVSWERNTQRRDKLTAPELVIKTYSW